MRDPLAEARRWFDQADAATTALNGQYNDLRDYWPAFLAYNSTTDTDVTGAGTGVTVDFDTEIFDQRENFSSPV